MPGPDRLREAVQGQAFPAVSSPDAAAAARAVVERGGPTVRGVVFFGSRKTRATPDAFSAYDLFVVVQSYRSFYRSLARSGLLARRSGLAAGLNGVLPPNQVSITGPGPDGGAVRAKCAVISLSAFRRETSARRHDHFLLGRLFQPAEVLFAADAEARATLLEGLLSAHRLSFQWVRPWLPEVFDVETYTRTLLRVSYAGEIRPEPAARADALWLAQREALVAAYTHLLHELLAAGEVLETGGGRYRLRRAASRFEALRASTYFRWSLVRATARWAKYMVTFEGWQEFMLRKVRRHSGQDIVLTSRERRFPLIFLWPRVLRYLRDKDAPRP